MKIIFFSKVIVSIIAIICVVVLLFILFLTLFNWSPNTEYSPIYFLISAIITIGLIILSIFELFFHHKVYKTNLKIFLVSLIFEMSVLKWQFDFLKFILGSNDILAKIAFLVGLGMLIFMFVRLFINLMRIKKDCA